MADVAEPEPGRRGVVVKVLASSINIDDIHGAEGTFYGGIRFGPRPRPHHLVTPGSDVAGIVKSVGDRVRSVQPGDAVFGVHLPFQAQGAWAEYCAVDERWLTLKPEGLSFCTAAACAISGLVALSAIHALNLKGGSHIVVVGATGGIGGMAVQLASRAGAHVIGICSAANFERARQLGCSQVFDYHGNAWDSAIKASGNVRIDGLVDTVGGRDIEEAGRRVLRRDGTFVTVVGPERFIGDHPLGWPGVLTVLAHIGYRLISSRLRGPRYILTGPTVGGGKGLAEIAQMAAAGVLPPIDSTVPFELGPMRHALRRAAAHQNHGRIVVKMGEAA